MNVCSIGKRISEYQSHEGVAVRRLVSSQFAKPEDGSVRSEAARTYGIALSAEVNEIDLADGMIQEARAEALEFFYGIGSEAANLRRPGGIHR